MDDDWTHNFRAIYFAKLEIEEIDRAEEGGVDIDDIPGYSQWRNNWRSGKSLRTQRKLLKQKIERLEQ